MPVEKPQNCRHGARLPTGAALYYFILLGHYRPRIHFFIESVLLEVDRVRSFGGKGAG